MSMPRNRRFRFAAFLFISSCLSAASLKAEVKLPAILADNMVLQQRSNDPIWGWASPGEEVSVTGSWKGRPVSTKADAQGHWMVKINTPAAGGPYTLTVKGTNTIVLHNIMIGEVWVCSGQSNMEMPVNGWGPSTPILHSAQEISAAQYPQIRLFTVKRAIALQPLDDCSGSWAACSPQTVGDFSATAYFFGKELYEKLHVPIGLIHTSWGGTPAEAWTDQQTLRKLGDFNDQLDKLNALGTHADQEQKKYDQQLAQWNEQAKVVKEQYAAVSWDDASWKTMKLPATWETAGLPNVDGIVWFRKKISLPASWAGKALKLSLGPVDDLDITWFNGTKVGGIREEGHWSDNRLYDIPAALVKAGDNEIAVQVTDLQGNGGIDGEAAQMKIYPAEDSGEAISLAGDWRYLVDLPKPVPAVTYNANSPSVLYNGMIAPIVPFALRGAIWYQGESNVGRAAQYEKLFPAMITNWRERWKQGNFPFYFVQIAPFTYGGDHMASAALRDAQRKSLSVPNTGMAVTLDIGNPTNIHPANKEEVGRRLSLWALANIYGKKVAYSGPLYDHMQVKGNQLILSFKHADGGLVAKGSALDNFQVAGSEGHFVPAHATIRGEQLILQSDEVAQPAAARYDWSDTGEAQLFNKAGLPASSFSTE